uniref:Uncharacterized protein n=1 Tax=Oryza barthii TaxID=65489 RepID=A0A0D3FF57_9ORYZ
MIKSFVHCKRRLASRGAEEGGACITLVAAIHVRDPSRRYEALGAPMVAVVQSARLLGAGGTATGGWL